MPVSKSHCLAMIVAAAFPIPSLFPLAAQMTAPRIEAPAGYAPIYAPCIAQVDGSCVPASSTEPLPTAAKQEAFQLVTANAPAAPATVYGGIYALSQSCASYNGGALVLRYRGPDGATMLALHSLNTSDTGGGTLVSLGSGAVVDIALPSGSSACNAILARVP
mgnify:FL=1